MRRLDDEKIDGQLSVELARRDPGGFAEQALSLLDGFNQGPITGSDLVSRLVNEGMLKSIQFDPDSWTGLSQFDQITVGVAPMPTGMKEKVVFDDARFGEDELVLYRLNHELSHQAASAIQKASPGLLERIYRAILASRGATFRGLSGLGSLPFYRGEGARVQAIEDVTELINMYLISPEYLKAFLRFLEDADESMLINLGLVRLESKNSTLIFKTIEEGVNRWISSRRS